MNAYTTNVATYKATIEAQINNCNELDNKLNNAINSIKAVIGSLTFIVIAIAVNLN